MKTTLWESVGNNVVLSKFNVSEVKKFVEINRPKILEVKKWPGPTYLMKSCGKSVG